MWIHGNFHARSDLLERDLPEVKANKQMYWYWYFHPYSDYKQFYEWLYELSYTTNSPGSE